MSTDDLEQAVDVAARAFEFEFTEPSERDGWVRRLGHALSTDPHGCFVAVERRRVVGVAQAIRREQLWNLSLLTVDPGSQSSGTGRRLLDAACGYMRPEDDGLIVASNDPRAIRIYGLAGFQIHPTLESVGVVDRAKLPPPDPRIREVGLDEIGQIESVTRMVRGAPYTRELPNAIAWGVQIYALEDSGYVILRQGRGIWALGAADDDSAKALLWFGLHTLGPDVIWPLIRWATGTQQWAVQVALDAGLRLQPFGAVCVHGRAGTLRNYLPSGPYG
jgi:GNAT superfamily N-acetyltransferase